jgi:UDP-N-acetylmuramyl pentapeptide phosphotransferase/UDP-N-acetylglucosamine-1-phosphate transferase
MLGDAGANPAGAVAGTLVVIGLPLWGMFVYLGVVFGLNLASELVSFSRVIEGNAFLHRLDMLGRTEAPTARPFLKESGEHPRQDPE